MVEEIKKPRKSYKQLQLSFYKGSDDDDQNSGSSDDDKT